MCDKKNKVLFTDSECLVLSPDFKLPDENQTILKSPTKQYVSFNLENLFLQEVETLSQRVYTTKVFLNWDSHLVACQKGISKITKASCKAKTSKQEKDASEEAEALTGRILNKKLRELEPKKISELLKMKAGLMLCKKNFQVYVDDIIFGSTKKSWCDEFEALMKSRFQMSSMGELTFFLGLQVKQKPNGIFISQDKYVAEILKKFDFASVKTAIVLVSRFQGHSKGPLHLSAIKRIFRKSTTGGCQFLGRRLITWQCKKQTIVATSITEAEYVAAASCYRQVLWIQNQMLDYGFNFMNTKIYIDNESTTCIVKNPVYHSKTTHIAIRHHFIRDAYEKKLIQLLKIHTNDNVADLLTKAFDVSRF
ncbi:putative ribonuclease H-like domain-containing protein [Tanacetum coccineum]